MRSLRLALTAALAIPLISCCLCVIELGPFPIVYICDGWLEDGEDLVPIVGDLGGPVDEILSRTGGAPFPQGVGLAVRKYILQKRGAIAHDCQRAPATSLTAIAKSEVDYLLSRLAQHDSRAKTPPRT